MKKIAIVSGILLAATAAVNVQAHPTNEGYASTTTDTIWHTGFGECWRHGFWKDANAVKGCTDYKEPVAAAPKAMPTPAPAPKPMVKKLSVSENHIVYFDYDSSQVKSVADISAYASSLTSLTSITLSGHTDKFGSNDYNMALSRSRVNAVADALIAEGVNRHKILTDYSGETKPAKVCEKDTKSCLAENRRVEVTVSGVQQVKQ